MIIHAISDLHGHKPDLDGGDLLVVAGDSTATNTLAEWQEFAEWLEYQDYAMILLVAGNHDGALKEDMLGTMARMPTVRYLEDELVEWRGLMIYGSPWTPEYYNWYFMKPRGEELRKVWQNMPLGLDILITHGPPHGILDTTNDVYHGTVMHAGDEELAKAVKEKRPRHHIFGHIHECGGQELKTEHTAYHNVSVVDRDYKLVMQETEIVL